MVTFSSTGRCNLLLCLLWVRYLSVTSRFWNGSMHLVKNGYRLRDFIGLPIGGKKVILRMKVQRYKCKNKDCIYDRQETIPFATGSCSYTHRVLRALFGGERRNDFRRDR